MDVTPLVWWVTIGAATVALLLDVAVVARRPHVPSMRECTTYLVVYVSLALLFGLFIWWDFGGQYAGEFYAGWLTEYSLSVDNLFVFHTPLHRRPPSRVPTTAPALPSHHYKNNPLNTTTQNCMQICQIICLTSGF